MNYRYLIPTFGLAILALNPAYACEPDPPVEQCALPIYTVAHKSGGCEKLCGEQTPEVYVDCTESFGQYNCEVWPQTMAGAYSWQGSGPVQVTPYSSFEAGAFCSRPGSGVAAVFFTSPGGAASYGAAPISCQSESQN